MFEDIILHLRDQTEQGQYQDMLMRHFGTTSGVATDINANIVSLYVGRNTELMDTLYTRFGTYNEAQEKIVLDCKSTAVVNYMFGNTNISAENMTDDLRHHLLTTQNIQPKEITNKYPGVHIELY